MVSVSCLNLSSCETEVRLFFVSGCDCGLVHDFTHQAFSVQRVVFFFPTATRVPFVFLWLRCFCYLQDGLVGAIYYLLDVGHAAVAELCGVPVESFPQFVARSERSFNEADERTSDVGFDAFVIWWIHIIQNISFKGTQNDDDDDDVRLLTASS